MRIRRQILSIALVAFASQVIVTQAMAQSAKPTIVIVHGAWGGAWAFRRVDALLRDKGYNVYRPQLTGLGDRVHLATAEVDLETHITDVVNLLDYEDLSDAVLVGHSYSGIVVTAVADRSSITSDSSTSGQITKAWCPARTCSRTSS